MKKQMQVIALIVFTAVILAGGRQFNKKQPKETEKIYMATGRDLLHDMTVKSWSISNEILYSIEEEKDEDTNDAMLKWFQEWYQNEKKKNVIRYQMEVPCHFFLNVAPYGDLLNIYEYRNIDGNDEILWDEDGRIYMEPAYIADVILDTYIREYGGEDTLYHLDIGLMWWIEPELEIQYSMKIYNDSVTLNVVVGTGGLPGACSVYIEDCDGAEVQHERMIEYAYHMDTEGCYDYWRKSLGDAYCMFIDPEPGQKKYQYRNVQMTDNVSEEDALVCDAFGYAIADRAIDKYIRDWDGSDILYDVKLINKIRDGEEGAYHYTLSVWDKEEEVLQIEYTEKEWFVMVNISN